MPCIRLYIVEILCAASVSLCVWFLHASSRTTGYEAAHEWHQTTIWIQRCGVKTSEKPTGGGRWRTRPRRKAPEHAHTPRGCTGEQFFLSVSRLLVWSLIKQAELGIIMMWMRPCLPIYKTSLGIGYVASIETQKSGGKSKYESLWNTWAVALTAKPSDATSLCYGSVDDASCMAQQRACFCAEGPRTCAARVTVLSVSVYSRTTGFEAGHERYQ